MNRFTKKAFDPLDKEEESLMESIANDEWQPVINFDYEKEKAVKAARNTLKKTKRMNIHQPKKNYNQVQFKSISSIIHEGYVSNYALA
jgi:hypothetical protein